MRRGSTLMKDTVSSAARKADLTGMEDTLGRLRKESDEKDLRGVVRQSSSSDDSLSWDSSSASSPQSHRQSDRLQKLKEMQKKYTADANLLVAAVAQETLLVDEQEMKVLMFNTFLVENLRKLFGKLEEEHDGSTSGSSKSQAERLEEFRQKLDMFLRESTNDLPIETHTRMSSAVNLLISELQANLATLTEYSLRVRGQSREDEEPEHGVMSTKTFVQLNAALQTMFTNRLKTVAKSLAFTGTAVKSDMGELKQATKTKAEVIRNMVATLKSELLQDVNVPHVVSATIKRRLSELGREARRRVKQEAKQLAEECRKTIHQTSRVSLFNVHRTPSPQFSSSDDRVQGVREVPSQDDDDRKKVKTKVKLQGFQESHEQRLQVDGIQTKVLKLQQKPSYVSTHSQLLDPPNSEKNERALTVRNPHHSKLDMLDMADMVEYIVDQLEQYTDYSSSDLGLIRHTFHMMSQSDQLAPKLEQVDFMRKRYIEIIEGHLRSRANLLAQLQKFRETEPPYHSGRTKSLFADDPEGVKMEIFMNSLRNSLKSQTMDPSTLGTQINILEQSIKKITENLELYSFPKLAMDSAVATGSQDTVFDAYLREQKWCAPEERAVSLPASDPAAHRIVKLSSPEVTPSSKLMSKDSILDIGIEGIGIEVGKSLDFPWKSKGSEPVLTSKLSSFLEVGSDREEPTELSGVSQEQDGHMSIKTHPERKDTGPASGSSITQSLPLHIGSIADMTGEQADEVTTTVTTIPIFISEGSSAGHVAKTPTTVRIRNTPKRPTILPPVLQVPRNSRIVSRPSWIPCRDWSRLVGPIAQPVVIYKTNGKPEAQFRRAVDLHMFPSTLQAKHDLGDIFKRATILSKDRLRLPPVGPYA
ncbi:hypothetical protein P879_05322 [Paragonimus westermani]|uniref:Uncharacterized protein n=1 Tax=Paragonimus westermani TaxID=34504 RepID=A0A8T0DIV5_9TREM|nr:hypothetical protein P879_05322 [Paragonimus westermani]